MTRFVDPLSELGGLLLNVEKPARYTGGEYGSLAKNRKHESFRSLIAFPDLYEIGMGNQALRIIYNRLNAMEGIFCDRAFAPAPDFEKLLRENNIPLYGLDTGIALNNLDLLLFTLGYELGIGGVLLMLESSFIPLRCGERTEEHPILIAGGPAVSNPLPYSLFIDAFWIGEAEAGFFDLVLRLAKLKEEGKGRAVLLEHIAAHPNIWVRGKEKAKRAIASDFSFAHHSTPVFPVPGMKIVQHHGAVEIMRGCPNGCRFCHAGFWYRPMRQKSVRQIALHVDDMVKQGGWQEISLSSLSSGDYNGISELVELLNNTHKNNHVSFQLPSLKVSGFSLSLLEKISVIRKSGLTFAVETPRDLWQMAINKEVTRDTVTAILEEAKKRGWKGAKFYFMIGLPLEKASFCEEEEIVNFITDIARRTGMHFNINVGLFVPKPHTPYQRAKQLETSEAVEKFDFIRSRLKPAGHKVSVSDALISRLEGFLSRGDERAGLIWEEAYKAGSRLESWNEYINKEKWRQLLEANKELVNDYLSGELVSWQAIDSRVKDEFLQNETEKSCKSERTPSCKEKCSLCGVCGKEVKICVNSDKIDDSIDNNVVNHHDKTVNIKNNDPDIYRVLFSFSKQGAAVFYGHLSLIEIFSMAFRRAGLPVMYTQGFNPLAKIAFASPLSTGIAAGGEMACADFIEPMDAAKFKDELNRCLPQGCRIENAECYHIPSGFKKHSLASLLWGYAYENEGNLDYVKACDEKNYRIKRLGTDDKAAVYTLKRSSTLAFIPCALVDRIYIMDSKKNGKPGCADTEYADYFDVYMALYAAPDSPSSRREV